MRTIPRAQTALIALLGVAAVVAMGVDVARAQGAPKFYYDPTWPNPLPNLWKLGGVTGLAVDKDDNVWVYNRPRDATDVERRAEPGIDIAVCCVRPPSMIHIDKAGNVIGSFDAPQGHGLGVDEDGFVYLGQDTVRKYDPATGQIVGEVAKTAEKPPREDAAAIAAFRRAHPPETPMIVGGLEEIRIVDADNEMYVADNYLGGRVLVFDLDTLAFKRGWGAYGKPLAQISLDDADHAYTPNGPMAKDFVGHLTLNVSKDGLVYAADRNGNRIQVTSKTGEFKDEFILAPSTGAGGSTGGIAFSPDPGQRYLYISDLTNNRIWFLNRSDGELLGYMGRMSDAGGQFFGLHMIDVDSAGNIYTGEVQNGERVQRFVPADSPRGRLLQQLASLP